jgi:hypothetical protein
MKNETRPAIPLDLKRMVLIESGHRCAIPTCKHPTTEIAHIIPWSKCKEHTFGNLIALCPNCHTRFDANQIDRKAMQTYKANLSLLNSRYSDLEKRIIYSFIKDQSKKEILIPGGLDLMLMYLIEDGMIIDTGKTTGVILSGMPSQKYYALTTQGEALIKNLTEANELT